MLLEEGFQVTSVDASDKMLKYALKERWERRKEEPFDRWGAGGRRGWEGRADTNILPQCLRISAQSPSRRAPGPSHTVPTPTQSSGSSHGCC